MLYSETIKLNVVSIDSGNELGKIKEIVIDHSNGKFLGLLLPKKNIVLAEDISEYGEDAVMVQSDNMAVPLKDNEEIENVLREKIDIVGNNVVTQSGEEIGEVKDFEVDEVTNMLTKIFVSTGLFKDLFKGKLEIAKEKIISIGKDAVVVKDDVIPAKEGEEAKEEVKDLARAGVLNKDLE